MRYAIRANRPHGIRWIFALHPFTNPAWTHEESAAKTWASKSGAAANVKRYQLHDVTIVQVAR